MFNIQETTTDDTATDVFVGTENTVAPPLDDNMIRQFDIWISARRTDSVGEYADVRYCGAISRGTGVASTALVGTPTKYRDQNSPGWAIALSADTSEGALKVQVTGESSKTIDWIIRGDFL